LAFTSVNLAVIARFYLGKKSPSPSDFFKYLLIPLLGAVADLWLMANLDKHALTLGAIWLILGFAYLAVLTGGFKRNPPELNFEGV
jgi:putrescine importer